MHPRLFPFSIFVFSGSSFRSSSVIYWGFLLGHILGEDNLLCFFSPEYRFRDWDVHVLCLVSLRSQALSLTFGSEPGFGPGDA